MKSNKAELLLKSKIVLYSSLVREIVIWKVPSSKYYPEGIKYRLVLADPFWKKVLLLFDNHAPKGHHVHIKDGKEYSYSFSSMETLIEDYLRAEKEVEKIYENNENKN